MRDSDIMEKLIHALLFILVTRHLRPWTLRTLDISALFWLVRNVWTLQH